MVSFNFFVLSGYSFCVIDDGGKSISTFLLYLIGEVKIHNPVWATSLLSPKAHLFSIDRYSVTTFEFCDLLIILLCISKSAYKYFPLASYQASFCRCQSVYVHVWFNSRNHERHYGCLHNWTVLRASYNFACHFPRLCIFAHEEHLNPFYKYFENKRGSGLDSSKSGVNISKGKQ